MAELKGRQKARVDGDVIYYTGRACKSGHFDARYVSTGNCVTCVKNGSAKQNEKRKQWVTIKVHVDDLETVKAINEYRRATL